MTRRFLVRVLAIGVGILAAGLLIEVGVRALGWDAPPIWEPDPVLGWKHIPGASAIWTEEGHGLVEINGLGLRDRERTLDRPTGTFRVAVFGDSMTEAAQVNLDQSFTIGLEQVLSNPARPVEVMNLGVNGYGPPQELLLFRQVGPQFRPNLVILAVFLDNDVADCHPELRSNQTGSPFAETGADTLKWDFSRAEQSYQDYHAEPKYTLRRTSALYRYLGSRWKRMADARAPTASASAQIPKRYQLYLSSPPPAWEQAWSVLERVILEFASEAKSQGSQLVILNMPAGQVVNDAAWRDVLEKHPAMAQAKWDLQQPRRRLTEFAHQHGVPLIDPFEEFRRAESSPPLFFGSVGHLTPAGHALMVRCLADAFKKNDWGRSKLQN